MASNKWAVPKESLQSLTGEDRHFILTHRGFVHIEHLTQDEKVEFSVAIAVLNDTNKQIEKQGE